MSRCKSSSLNIKFLRQQCTLLLGILSHLVHAFQKALLLEGCYLQSRGSYSALRGAPHILFPRGWFRFARVMIKPHLHVYLKPAQPLVCLSLLFCLQLQLLLEAILLPQFLMLCSQFCLQHFDLVAEGCSLSLSFIQARSTLPCTSLFQLQHVSCILHLVNCLCCGMFHGLKFTLGSKELLLKFIALLMQCAGIGAAWCRRGEEPVHP
mmetsp:Transcript_31563/g.69640  ORF Transcript_31563/g.69640 Transcript_31563/m.69640 type:complete len:208 (+) Transcript_31563:644-1267(+)